MVHVPCSIGPHLPQAQNEKQGPVSNALDTFQDGRLFAHHFLMLPADKGISDLGFLCPLEKLTRSLREIHETTTLTLKSRLLSNNGSFRSWRRG